MEIEFTEVISYLLPPLLLWNVWLHKMVIKAQLEIAVNSAKDEHIIKEIEELKVDVKALAKEFHDFIVKYKA